MSSEDIHGYKADAYLGGEGDKDVVTQDTVEVPREDPKTYEEIYNNPHRGLRMRHVQLLSISGAGSPLTAAGPLGLLIGVIVWSTVIFGASNCLVEMTTLLPIDGGFITFAGRFMDDTIGKAVGWNFLLAQASLVCFELTAFNVMIEYWTLTLNPAIPIAIGLILFAALQLYSVRWFGEVEFWISYTKILLQIGLTLYTLVAMCGGNPLHDKFGFRSWKSPGPFGAAETPALRMKGIWDAVLWSCFALGGPDWISLIGGEVKNPRKILPKAFNSTVLRIILFFYLGALCVGINAPADDPALLGAIAAGAPGAAKSPYIISMNRLQIPFLPDLVNALVLVSIFSTGNAAVFCSSRGLYSLALRGAAPSVFKRLNRNGVPYLAVTAILLFGCLAFLSLGSGSVVVLNWFLSLVGAANLVNWTSIAVTYMRFRAGLKAQGKLNDDFLPVRAYLQPFSSWWVVICAPIAFIASGYALMVPGGWAGDNFVFTYGAVFIFAGFIILFKTWEVLRHKKPIRFFIPASEIDLTSDLDVIEAITAASEYVESHQDKSKGKKISDFFS
uniref:Amino acid transporter n=1 Tax=Kwoniella pini CBS 10737 TaxID=1296096 RepID=A0A1B9I6Z7_9TREE|nr:amino acid transporter [Kwoniella pini CBS 10737]OCF51318.1 amino acid transporter [Kwoniella pini CBS 10737]